MKILVKAEIAARRLLSPANERGSVVKILARYPETHDINKPNYGVEYYQHMSDTHYYCAKNATTREEYTAHVREYLYYQKLADKHTRRC